MAELTEVKGQIEKSQMFQLQKKLLSLLPAFQKNEIVECLPPVDDQKKRDEAEVEVQELNESLELSFFQSSIH